MEIEKDILNEDGSVTLSSGEIITVDDMYTLFKNYGNVTNLDEEERKNFEKMLKVHKRVVIAIDDPNHPFYHKNREEVLSNPNETSFHGDVLNVGDIDIMNASSAEREILISDHAVKRSWCPRCQIIFCEPIPNVNED